MVARHRMGLLAVVIAIAVLASLVTGLLVLRPSSAPGSNCTPDPPIGLKGASSAVMAPCETTLTLEPHSFTSYTAVRLSDHESFVGQYTVNTSTQGSIEAYLLNSSEMGGLLSNPHPTAPPSSYFWSSGPAVVCNLSVSVPGSPNQYFLVLENLSTVGVSFEWTRTLVLYYSSTPTA